MATKASIIAGIEFKVGGSSIYSAWKIGVTHDPEERQRYWKYKEITNIDRWGYWQANSLGEAQEIESRFIEKGMTGCTGGNLSRFKPVFVYVL